MRILVSGGCKNGKSYYAQRLAKAQQTSSLYYIATMASIDSEDAERIKRHKQERLGWGFTTIEQPAGIEDILQKCASDGSFLLDSLTALLANEMFPPNNSINERAADKIMEGLSQVLSSTQNIVVVSDDIFSDAVIYDPFSESYRRFLADIDRGVGRICDAVLEISFTNMIVHKGSEAFDALYKKIR